MQKVPAKLSKKVSMGIPTIGTLREGEKAGLTCPSCEDTLVINRKRGQIIRQCPTCRYEEEV